MRLAETPALETLPLLRANDNRKLRRRHPPLSLAAEGVVPEHDPAYLAQIRARKAMLQAQAVLLQVQASDLVTAGAAD
jgi:hypothetical protein